MNKKKSAVAMARKMVILAWLNEEIRSGVGSNFFHDDYNTTLLPVYGNSVDPESVVVEKGVVK
jgi:polar amino acid transport system substrate-binding protein